MVGGLGVDPLGAQTQAPPKHICCRRWPGVGLRAPKAREGSGGLLSPAPQLFYPKISASTMISTKWR